MASEQDRITLREAFLHSKLCEKITLYEQIDIYVRPWTPVIIREAIPILKDIMIEFKTLKAFKEDSNLFESVMAVVQKSEKLLNDTLHLVYITLEVSNPDLPFTEEEAQKYLVAEYYVAIMKLIWEQNVTKNLSSGLKNLGLEQKLSVEKPKNPITTLTMKTSQTDLLV